MPRAGGPFRGPSLHTRPMSANVEIAKQATDALNRRDWDAFYRLITVDFEWLPAMPGAVAQTAYRVFLDHDEARRAAGLSE